MVIKQRKTENQSHPLVPEADPADLRTADSYFPLDIAYQASCGSNLLFRLEIQEYEHNPHTLQHKPSTFVGGPSTTIRPEDSEMKSLFSHILANDERNAFLFTIDMTTASSFKLYLKKAIKDLIFAHEEVMESRSSNSKKSQFHVNPEVSLSNRNQQMVPFMVVGMKKDR